MNTLLGREPVLWLALVNAAIALGVGFGLPVTPAQMALIMTFSSAVLAFLTRQQVTSTFALNNPKPPAP